MSVNVEEQQKSEHFWELPKWCVKLNGGKRMWVWLSYTSSSTLWITWISTNKKHSKSVATIYENKWLCGIYYFWYYLLRPFTGSMQMCLASPFSILGAQITNEAPSILSDPADSQRERPQMFSAVLSYLWSLYPHHSEYTMTTLWTHEWVRTHGRKWAIKVRWFSRVAKGKCKILYFIKC